jgi:branched-subunit amino acid ABC-type transport system permease component
MRGAGWCLLLVGVAACAGVTSRLPRTSAGQLAAAAAAQNKTAAQLRGNRTSQATIGPPPGRGASSRVR